MFLCHHGESHTIEEDSGAFGSYRGVDEERLNLFLREAEPGLIFLVSGRVAKLNMYSIQQ